MLRKIIRGEREDLEIAVNDKKNKKEKIFEDILWTEGWIDAAVFYELGTRFSSCLQRGDITV